ncbi:putative Zn-dependent protease [Nocardia sp. GAS34]|uniref:hypothetical protein n=1 Tax=unclassified Nocardia TaxID=2637762 RepID=UPI003D1E1207
MNATQFSRPMRLVRDRIGIGTITDYGYETPWATGRIEFLDPTRAETCEQCVEFERWLAETDDLPEDDAQYDAACAREAARRGLTPADLDLFHSGAWTITTDDGDIHDVPSLEFLGDGYVQWRW